MATLTKTTQSDTDKARSDLAEAERRARAVGDNAPETPPSTYDRSPKGLGVGTFDPNDPNDLRHRGRETNVGDIAAGMMGKDSRLMQKAKAEGMQFANRRGLLNSSMAGQAGQSAMLDQIVPMASQTGQQRHARNLQGGEFAFQGEQAGIDRDLKLEIVRREEALQRETLRSEEAQAAAERALKKTLSASDIAQQERRGAESMLANAFRDYEEAQRSILSNPKLPAKERNKLLDNAQNMLNSKIDYASNLHSMTFDWPENPFESSDKTSGGLFGNASGSASGARRSGRTNQRRDDSGRNMGSPF